MQHILYDLPHKSFLLMQTILLTQQSLGDWSWYNVAMSEPNKAWSPCIGSGLY